MALLLALIAIVIVADISSGPSALEAVGIARLNLHPKWQKALVVSVVAFTFKPALENPKRP